MPFCDCITACEFAALLGEVLIMVRLCIGNAV